ncbi:MAG: 3-hydroxyacyl-CoA dehydrogenase family protein [Victivallaceae bacterium]|nr:3-hydroxyacyl-CoA dehydrogenase family protein [Victivallaceae bacterium]
MKKEIIGIIGSGVMGGGIAQLFAENGFQVIIWDVKKELAEQGMTNISKRLFRSVEKGKLTETAAKATLAGITATDKLGGFAEADLVIEAVVEDAEIKTGIYRQLEQVLRPEAIIGTNTSSLSVAGLAAALIRPERFFGIHFFNPPTKLELVELIILPGYRPEALNQIKSILTGCGKTAVEVKDSPGFIVNRLLLPLINEAAKLVDAGVASPQDIDLAMTLGALHPAGPLQIADLIGLDVCKHILDTLAKATGDPGLAPAKSIVELVAAGKLGRKTGRGFHTY